MWQLIWDRALILFSQKVKQDLSLNCYKFVIFVFRPMKYYLFFKPTEKINFETGLKYFFGNFF